VLKCILVDTSCIHKVLVNPEPERHVGLRDQVKDSTTRHIDVAVCIPILEVDTSSAANRINKQTTNGRRSAISNVEAEHETKDKWIGAS